MGKSLELTVEQKVKENEELTAICDELIAKVGSWQDQYRAECKTRLVKTGQTNVRSYRTDVRQTKHSNSRDNLLRRDGSFVLETSSEVLLRRQRSASRESPPTLRQGSRMTRPVSVPSGSMDVGLHGLASTSDHSVRSTTPRRSHSDCYTRSSPKQIRKFRPSSSKKMWISVSRLNTYKPCHSLIESNLNLVLDSAGALKLCILSNLTNCPGKSLLLVTSFDI